MNAWGRLTLQSGCARMGQDVASNIIYYTPFENDSNREIAFTLNNTGPNCIYDIFLTPQGQLTDLIWSPTGLQHPKTKQGGLWYSPEGWLYVGTIRTKTANTVYWQPQPSYASGGTNNELGVFNAYNRLPTIAVCRDSNSIWHNSNPGYSLADNSPNFRINWLDGLGDVACRGNYTCSVAGDSTNAAALTVGVSLNGSTWNGLLPQGAMNNNSIGMQISGWNMTHGSVGAHYWQAMEQSTPVPVTVFGNNFAALTAELCI